MRNNRLVIGTTDFEGVIKSMLSKEREHNEQLRIDN